MTSYTRARAESLVLSCQVGFLERAERIVLIIIGGLFNHMGAVLWVIAFFSNLIVLHRCLYTRQRFADLPLPPRNSLPPSPCSPPLRYEQLASTGDQHGKPPREQSDFQPYIEAAERQRSQQGELCADTGALFRPPAGPRDERTVTLPAPGRAIRPR